MGLLTSAVGPTDPGPRGAHAHAAPLLQLQGHQERNLLRVVLLLRPTNLSCRLCHARTEVAAHARPRQSGHRHGRPAGTGRTAGGCSNRRTKRDEMPPTLVHAVQRAEEESSHASSARRRRWQVAKQLGCVNCQVPSAAKCYHYPNPPRFLPPCGHRDAIQSSHRDRGTCTLVHDNGRAELTKHRRKKIQKRVRSEMT